MWLRLTRRKWAIKASRHIRFASGNESTTSRTLLIFSSSVGEGEGEGEGEGWSGECGRSVPSRQIVKPARRRRTRVAEKNVLGACPFVHERVCAD